MSQTVWLKFLRLFPPELAHRMSVRLLQLLGRLPGALPSDRAGIHCFGLNFPHRLGVAAGMDKDAEAYHGLMKLGFGFVEVGTVTPKPQGGNPKPRLFRLPQDDAVINRMGFNNRGVTALVERIAKTHHLPRYPLGINIGPNKTSQEPWQDFVFCYKAALGVADYFTINLSSPNTPGLRDLQRGSMMQELLQLLRETRRQAHEETGLRPPVLLKLAPDWQEKTDFLRILDAGIAQDFDGFIISNTTITRPASLVSTTRHEAGGLSGAPLFALSTAMLATAFRHLQGAVPLVGAGGIASIDDAMLKISAGASLLQVYTGLSHSSDDILPILSQKPSSLSFRPLLTSEDTDGQVGALADQLDEEEKVMLLRNCKMQNAKSIVPTVKAV